MPYPTTQPKTLDTASEVATMDFVGDYGIPSPSVFAYSLYASNPVGAEYIVIEKIFGRCPGDVWYDPSDE